jgi:hypothetical protein
MNIKCFAIKYNYLRQKILLINNYTYEKTYIFNMCITKLDNT